MDRPVDTKMHCEANAELYPYLSASIAVVPAMGIPLSSTVTSAAIQGINDWISDRLLS